MKRAILLIALLTGCTNPSNHNLEYEKYTLKEVVQVAVKAKKSKIKNDQLSVYNGNVYLKTDNFIYQISEMFNYRTCIQINNKTNTITIGKSVNDQCKREFAIYGERK